MTVHEGINKGTELLTGSGAETPYLDAVVLLAEAIGITKEKLFASFTDPIPLEAADKYREYLQKRSEGFPVSYIRKKKEFYGRNFHVDNRVLVPRPDTEIMIDSVMEILNTRITERPVNRNERGITLLDLCTGSGCIALTIAAECREQNIPMIITASDISAEAGEVFSINSKAILGRELPFTRSDLFKSIKGTFDIIVSNPPYLTTEDIDRFREMNWPEPETALFGGGDGLDIIREIIEKSVEYLNINGYLLLEASPVQMNAIDAMLIKEGFADTRRILDLGNRNRIIIARYQHG